MVAKKQQPFDLYVMDSDPGFEPLKVILPKDGTQGLVIGEDWEVRYLQQLLEEYLVNGKHQGEIPDYHEQLGALWLNSNEAVELSSQNGETIPIRTIRWAAAHGFITGAQKSGRDWRFPQRTFLYWMRHRPKPGRTTKEIVDDIAN